MKTHQRQDLASALSSVCNSSSTQFAAPHSIGKRWAPWRAWIILTSILAAASIAARAQTSDHATEPSAMQKLQRAVRLAESGDVQNAMALDQELLAKDPEFAPAVKLKAMILEETGDAAQAAITYEQALHLAPDDPDLLLKSGMYKLLAGDKKDAIRLLQHCVQLQPEDGDAQFYLAQAYHLDGQDDLALRAMRQSIKLEPGNAAVMQKYGEMLSSSGDSQNALQWLLRAQQADATLPGIDYDIGVADYNLMDLPNAALNLEHAVAARPTDANALNLLASTQVKLSRWQAAKEIYARLLAVKPNDPDLLLGFGQCQLGLRDYRGAIDTLNSALSQDPTRFAAHFYLSRAYAAIGQMNEAQHEAALHELMMQQMTFVQSAATEQRENQIREQTRQLLTQHRAADVLRLYRERFRDISDGPANAYVFLGKSYLFMGDTNEGLQALHHALQIDPKVHGAHTYEGILDLKMGDLAGAEKQFQAELANDPSYQQAIAEMGEVFYHQQRWAEAAAWLAKSKTMTPELLYMLSDAYFHLGKTADADLNAEAAAAYGRSDADFMHGLLALLARNGQTELAEKLAVYIKP